MHKLTRLAGVAILATAALLLTACGSSSYMALKTSLSVTAKGTMNLSGYSADSTDVSSDAFDFGIPTGAPRVIPAGSNGKATIDLAFTYDGGNWNVNGNYKDGAVQFKFKGYALFAAAELYMCGLGPCGSPINRSFASALSNSQPSGISLRGGSCVPVITHYESTNRAMPGTGYALFKVCDAPVNGVTPLGNFPNGGSYTGPDYVKVYIPFAMSGDQEPFAYYLSGGTLSGRESNVSVSLTGPSIDPSYSPTPIYPSPTSSQPAPPSLIR